MSYLQQVFHEARRSLPSIIYVPHIDQWWNTMSDTLRATFMSLLHDLDPASPLLFLATSDVPYDQLDSEVGETSVILNNHIQTIICICSIHLKGINTNVFLLGEV